MLLIFYSLLLLAASSHAVNQDFTTCGLYQSVGTLKITTNHQYILDINGGTRHKKEILILSPSKNLMAYNHKAVKAEVLVYKLLSKNESNKAILKSIVLDEKSKEGISFVKKHSCI